MNNWANPSRASAQEVAEMASSLENRAQALDQVQVNIELMNVLNPVSGEHLLEVGCGTGVLCRQMAPAVALGGKVTGFDISVEFVRIASARSKLSNSFHWGVGQAENLPFPDSIFDGGDDELGHERLPWGPQVSPLRRGGPLAIVLILAACAPGTNAVTGTLLDKAGLG